MLGVLITGVSSDLGCLLMECCPVELRKVCLNCLAIVLLAGDMLLEARHISGLSIRRPVDRGFVVSWDTQQEIWSRGLTKVATVCQALTLAGPSPPLLSALGTP